MTWIIIGSTAAKHWFDDWREPKDIDILSPAKITSTNSLECIIDSKWHDLVPEIISLSTNKVFADPNILLTLKVSHAYWDIHWDKTMYDIHKLQKRKAVINQELHDKLVKLWNEIHGHKKVSMKQSVEEFFEDGVTRKYSHEFLHELMAFNDTPMHIKIRDDVNSVFVNKSKFFALSKEQQLQTALEEILVVAVERGNLDITCSKQERKKWVKYALFKLCTSMTKGWFAQFLVQNHFELLYNTPAVWQDHLTKVLREIES